MLCDFNKIKFRQYCQIRKCANSLLKNLQDTTSNKKNYFFLAFFISNVENCGVKKTERV